MSPGYERVRIIAHRSGGCRRRHATRAEPVPSPPRDRTRASVLCLMVDIESMSGGCGTPECGTQDLCAVTSSSTARPSTVVQLRDGDDERESCATVTGVWRLDRNANGNLTTDWNNGDSGNAGRDDQADIRSPGVFSRWGGLRSQRFTGASDSSMSVTAKGVNRPFERVRGDRADITMTASGTGFLAGTDAMINLGSVETATSRPRRARSRRRRAAESAGSRSATRFSWSSGRVAAA